MILKAISVDFWSDTLANLETLSQSTGIPKNEIIRRGTEISLLLHGLSEKEAIEWLLESLCSNAAIPNCEDSSHGEFPAIRSR